MKLRMKSFQMLKCFVGHIYIQTVSLPIWMWMMSSLFFLRSTGSVSRHQCCYSGLNHFCDVGLDTYPFWSRVTQLKRLIIRLWKNKFLSQFIIKWWPRKAHNWHVLWSVSWWFRNLLSLERNLYKKKESFLIKINQEYLNKFLIIP